MALGAGNGGYGKGGGDDGRGGEAEPCGHHRGLPTGNGKGIGDPGRYAFGHEQRTNE